ncbi:uncharacterized protein LOC125001026 isoform X2 [Mugil cephalus]|uniref:uncharacterized protein LOC125001026 isoform X2 n=1 Tax=Mugil cephalus TaxID=48193 RepID=UPI001FB6384A|nr:uncharacterized protein LOC125001026 isoform X2 [Mugil cephalus]
MDQCEDREEGVPPFKRNVMRLAAMYMKKCEAQSVRQTVERKHKPEPKPDPSCVSMKSDGSMNRPIRFDSRRIHQKPEYPEPKTKLKHKPDPSCVSMKSDWSMDCPIKFDSRRVKQQSLNVLSDQSVHQHQTQLDSIFKLLEDKVVTFVKKELKKIQRDLNPDYPECLESQREDERCLR